MRFFFKLLIFLTLCSSGPALALGLGGIRLFSYLNEPLDAEIRLISADGTTPGSLKVRFLENGNERLGYEPGSFSLRSLRFKLMYPKGRPAVIHVTSTRRVREPVVGFVLELVGPNVRIQRDYTLLLDPPPYITNPRSRRSTDRRPVEVETVTDAPAATKRAKGSTYGPVSDGDTLSHIALRTRPSRDISIHRMTQALFRRNPDAFINGNINLLRKGVRLEVPALDELRATGEMLHSVKKTLTVAVEEQSDRAQDTDTRDKDTRQPAPTKRSPTAKEGQKNQDVLRLVSAHDAVAEVSQTAAHRERLKRELKEVSQDLASVREENRVLRERVVQMETLLRKMRQQARRMLNDQQQTISASPAVPSPAPTSKTRQLDTTKNLDSESQPVPQSPVSGTWAHTLLGWLWWVSLGLAVALVVAALLLMRSKDEVARARQASLTVTDDQPVTSAQPAHDVADVPTEEAVAVDNTFEQEAPEETEPQFLTFLRTEIDTNAAYGRYAAAKKALDRALDLAPNDIELVVKAFELARLQDDVDSFVAWVERAGKKVAKRAPAIWESISKEGRAWIPDHPVWGSFETPTDSVDAASNQ